MGTWGVVVRESDTPAGCPRSSGTCPCTGGESRRVCLTGLALFVTQECSPLSSLSRNCSRMKEFPSQVLRCEHPWEFIRGFTSRESVSCPRSRRDGRIRRDLQQVPDSHPGPPASQLQ